MTMRRYFVTVPPGVATGYWKAMNKPRRAGASGAGPGRAPPPVTAVAAAKAATLRRRPLVEVALTGLSLCQRRHCRGDRIPVRCSQWPVQFAADEISRARMRRARLPDRRERVRRVLHRPCAP